LLEIECVAVFYAGSLFSYGFLTGSPGFPIPVVCLIVPVGKEKNSGFFTKAICIIEILISGLDDLPAVKHYLPGISTVFLTTPVKFSRRLIQFIGRALRPAPEKGRAVMFDFVDVLKGGHSCLLLTAPWIKMQSNMP